MSTQSTVKYRSGSLQDRNPIELPFIPGIDVAGTVEVVGANISRLNVGDKVFGGKHGGSYAEYVALNDTNVAIAPANVSLTKAAALVVSLVTSYSFLIEYGAVKTGQRLFIQGIAGGRVLSCSKWLKP